MRLGIKLVAFTCLLILTGMTFAAERVCPELNAIQVEGMTIATSTYGSYITMNISSYDTDSVWRFMIIPVEADSKGAAIKKANDILSKMNTPGVVIVEQGRMICRYDTGISDVSALIYQDN